MQIKLPLNKLNLHSCERGVKLADDIKQTWPNLIEIYFLICVIVLVLLDFIIKAAVMPQIFLIKR